MHASLIDYLNRGKPKLIVYDVLFADEDLRVGFPYGGDTWSGPESDKALADTIKKAGNVVLLADATFAGETTEKQTLPDQGYRINVPGVLERRVVFPPAGPLSGAAAALGHNFLSLDPDGPVRHVVPFVRTGDNAMPSLGLSAALRASGLNPSAVRIDGRSLIAGDRLMPLEMRRVNTEGGVTEMLWGLIHFRGPAFLADMKRRPYPHYSFFDLLYSEEQLLAEQKPDIDPAVFRDKIVFVGVTAAGLFDVFETPFAGGLMPGIQIHASVADDFLSNRVMRPESRSVRFALVVALALLRWPDLGASAGVVGRRDLCRDRCRRSHSSPHGSSPPATGSTSRSRRSRRRSRCLAASAISTSSKGARSAR